MRISDSILIARSSIRSNVFIARPQFALKRNCDIVLAGVELIACPHQMSEVLRSGTWSTVRFARKIKKRVVMVWPHEVKP